MPDLPQNEQYQKQTNLSGAIAPLLKTAEKVGSGVNEARRKVSKKRVDVSGYQDFASNLGKYNIGSTGAAGSITSGVPTGFTQTVPFGGQTKFEQFHKGTDLGAPIGTKIPSFDEGVVTGVVTGKKHLEPGAPYGNQVIVTDPKTGNQWRYSHLQDAYVQVGSKVSKGDVIGSVGISGNTYSEQNPQSGGPHLDLRIYNIYKKNFFDPLSQT